MPRLDDPELLSAASRALDELTRRDRDTLEQAILDNKPIEEIARASLISIERAAFWMDNARTQFREKLREKLAQIGEAELSPTEDLDLLAEALRQNRKPRARQTVVMSRQTLEIPVLDAAVTCPKCGARFHDHSNQYAAYAKLAAEGRIGLMIGCTACSMLFVP